MSAAELARQFDVPTNRVTEILNRRRATTGDKALRFAHFFETTAEFWLNLQSLYELRIAQKKVGRSIDRLPTLNDVGEALAKNVSIESAGKTIRYNPSSRVRRRNPQANTCAPITKSVSTLRAPRWPIA
jgi:addiction module HigA family antidote